jgi:hypothetical protein
MSRFYPELEKLNLEELITRFYTPHGHEDGFAYYYDEVAERIRERGQSGYRFLVKALKTVNEDDEERLHALLVALLPSKGEPLSRHYKRWLIDRFRFYLDDKRHHILDVALVGLYLLGVKSEIDRILSFRDHPFVFVRRSVIRYIGEFNPERAMPILINALKDEHEFVRSEAADRLGLLGKGEAIPHLQLLLNDSDPQVQESAQNAIEYIETELAIERIMEKGSPDEQDALMQLLERWTGI